MKIEETENTERRIVTVGEFLRQTRIKKGLTVDDVSKDLYIRRLYIEAIEDANRKELPPVPYGIAFIRTYAQYLRLNVERVVQLYKEEIAENDREMDFLKPQDEKPYPSKQYVIGGIIAALVIYLLYMLFSGISKNKENEFLPVVIEDDIEAVNEPDSDVNVNAELRDAALKVIQKEAQEKDVATYSEDQQNVENSEQAIKDNAEKSAGEKPRVVIKIKDETWLKVKNDKQIYFEKLVQNGFVYEVPNEKGIVITIGRPFNADVLIDGEIKVFTTERKPVHINLDEYLNNKHH